MIRIAVAEDHALTRKVLQRFFESEPGFRWVGAVANAEDAVHLVRSHEVDAMVLDLSLPGAMGLEALPQLRAAAPDLRILVLSACPAPMYARECRQLGASFYLEKATDLTVLAATLRSIMDEPLPAAFGNSPNRPARLADGRGPLGFGRSPLCPGRPW